MTFLMKVSSHQIDSEHGGFMLQRKRQLTSLEILPSHQAAGVCNHVMEEYLSRERAGCNIIWDAVWVHGREMDG